MNLPGLTRQEIDDWLASPNIRAFGDDQQGRIAIHSGLDRRLYEGCLGGSDAAT